MPAGIEPRIETADVATTMVGGVMWKLIEPIEADDLFGQFLKQRHALEAYGER